MLSANELRTFFLEAAAKTYATGTIAKTTIPDLPGSKVYRYERDGLLYMDTYFTSGEYSGGQTVLYAADVPQWLMQYHGYCKSDDRRILSFLKRALAAAYVQGMFCGGRGPEEYPTARHDEPETGLLYRNFHDPRHPNFDYFSGVERIFDRNQKYLPPLFWHRYQGFMFADPVPNAQIAPVSEQIRQLAWVDQTTPAPEPHLLRYLRIVKR